ncbi:MAG: nucleotidyl transferase AbiEii/AbiGii toxin family protein [Candidatus Algichlamydia australiensis]|nr:nucleotidyl transferase AbiEii/AbiGii toxin family protein [Chlamydiales bacterium]
MSFLLRQIDAEESRLYYVFEEIASMRLEDGFAFHLVKIKSLMQRHMLYPGFRIFLSANFGAMRDQIRLDIGIGDLVEPTEREIPQVKFRNNPLFLGDIVLKTYPIGAIFSEKVETVISKGSLNSRMKDYHDLFIILKNKERLNTEKLRKQVHKTFSKRKTAAGLVNFSDGALKSLQRLWSAHYLSVANQAYDLDLPKIIEEIINEINAYLASNVL